MVSINPEWLKVASKCASIEESTEYLLLKVFTKEELYSHSITGRTVESNRRRGIINKRPPIDQGKLERVRGKFFFIHQ